MNKNINNKVLVCLSGGVDSTAAALLLKKQGYNVVTATFRIFDKIQEGCNSKIVGCCSYDSILTAKEIANKLNVEHYILDYRQHFEDTVIKNFVVEYSSGRTPNPCVLCNYEIKWYKVLEYANAIGCNYIATGHYARVYSKNHRYVLASGLDEKKDQSYFLWMLSQTMLQKTLFPLGCMLKSDVKLLVKANGLDSIVNKYESQEICFIPNNDYRSFISKYLKNYQIENKKGYFITQNGEVLGEHKGIAFYTIGQRKKLNIATGKRMYVKKIDFITGNIILSEYENLKTKKFSVKNINFISQKNFHKNDVFIAKVRYKTAPVKVKISEVDDNEAIIEPIEDVYAVTPGQSIVFYNDEKEVVAGGIIDIVYD
ncbi:MAG: tRNA 2-thiouridine(34) synthase MnmA [Bacteroidales bacterium]|nr:tRNA 2-thiouridine(34) synthase MnmA [Bacteroidales bacterium]